MRTDKIFFSGVGLSYLLFIEESRLYKYATINYGSHNARPFKDGVIFNDTSNNRIVYSTIKNKIINHYNVKSYNSEDLLMSHIPNDHARQAFGRGMCLWYDKYIIGGSSPATISIYSFDKTEPIKSINVSMDIRNSIHGLEIWE